MILKYLYDRSDSTAYDGWYNLLRPLEIFKVTVTPEAVLFEVFKFT